jgi:hypothetical protein
MPPLAPARCRVQIGWTGSAVGRLVADHPCSHLAASDNFGYTSTTQTSKSGGREFDSLRSAPGISITSTTQFREEVVRWHAQVLIIRCTVEHLQAAKKPACQIRWDVAGANVIHKECAQLR